MIDFELQPFLVEAFNQPAKRADRVIAPGDGAAEPGVQDETTTEPTKWAADEGKECA